MVRNFEASQGQGRRNSVRASLFQAMFIACVAASSAAASSLNGSTVDLGLYCCTAPTEAYRVANIATAQVDAVQTEFPINTFTFISDGTTWDEGAIDVGSNFVRLDLFTSGTTLPGTFNGFVFTFTGAPAITGVSVDPASTFLPAAISQTANQLFVNVASRPYTAGSSLVLDLALAPVPEPTSALLMLGGGLVLAFRLRRPVDPART
jgi:hypothetical protein